MGLRFEYPYIFVVGCFLLIVYAYFRWKLLLQKSLAYAPLQLNAPKRKKFSWHQIKLPLELLLLLVVFFSMSAPYKLLERNMVLDRGLDIVFSLDVSASMQASDFPPTRLEFLKKVTSNFIKKNTTNRMGVYVFARDTFTQTPLTTDHKILLELMRGITFAMIDHNKSGGTAIGDALLAATDTLVKQQKPNRDRVIILITDGENTHGVDPLLAARYVRANQVRLYIVGVAGDKPIEVYVAGRPYVTSSGAILKTSLDDTQLKEIAKEANGRYYRAKDASVLQKVFAELLTLEQTPIEIKKLSHKVTYSHYLALLSMLLFLIWFVLEGFLLRRPMR
ncbi:MAG: VWA domain-containing protein [Spirochaetota bacterium]